MSFCDEPLATKFKSTSKSLSTQHPVLLILVCFQIDPYCATWEPRAAGSANSNSLLPLRLIRGPNTPSGNHGQCPSASTFPLTQGRRRSGHTSHHLPLPPLFSFPQFPGGLSFPPPVSWDILTSKPLSRGGSSPLCSGYFCKMAAV